MTHDCPGNVNFVDFTKVGEVRWNVMDPKYDHLKLSDKWYWCCFAQYGQDRMSILESGLVDTKVEALTRARKSARYWRGVHHREKAGEFA